MGMASVAGVSRKSKGNGGHLTDVDEAASEAVTQTWWLSFNDGERFIGVAIVDVDADDADEAEDFIRERRAERGLVTGVIDEHAKYIGGALRVAHLMGCNPGSEVHATRLDNAPGFIERDAAGKLPRNRLLSKAELERVGAID